MIYYIFLNNAMNHLFDIFQPIQFQWSLQFIWITVFFLLINESFSYCKELTFCFQVICNFSNLFLIS